MFSDVNKEILISEHEGQWGKWNRKERLSTHVCKGRELET
jgi:hypothetical protein